MKKRYTVIAYKTPTHMEERGVHFCEHFITLQKARDAYRRLIIENGTDDAIRSIHLVDTARPKKSKVHYNRPWENKKE